MAAVDGDDDTLICTLHPFQTTSPGGGICAFCLQDKLGQLVSSSTSPSFLPLSPPSSFRSDLPSSSTYAAASTVSSGGVGNGPGASRLPFLLTPKKNDAALFLKRSKSTTASSSAVTNVRYGDYSAATPRRRGFWSFLHLSHKKNSNLVPAVTQPPAPPKVVVVVEDDTDSSNENLNSNNTTTTTSFERKVTRSRSVGCGSRSFSGDLFERISSGFGDCTLRRVESHREGVGGGRIKHRHSTSTAMREKVRCGGLFSGLMTIASSSSSISTASSSSYWAENPSGGPNGVNRPGQNGKGRSWGWAFASPRRAFSGTSRSIKSIDNGRSQIENGQSQSQINGRNESNSTSTSTSTSKSKTPNLDAIPSLLSVRS